MELLGGGLYEPVLASLPERDRVDQLSRMAGTQHTFYELDERYLREFLPNLARMVSLTDGMYLSHGLTEMLAFRFIEIVAHGRNSVLGGVK